MKINSIHSWNLTIEEAVALQRRLQLRLRHGSVALQSIRHIAGADISLAIEMDVCFGAVAVLSFPALEVVEVRTARAALAFPYVPGLLSFREIPVLLQALKKIETPFEVMLCDGQGIAHPRGIGLASHLGLFIETPTIGCAKSRLVGDHESVGAEKGAFAALTRNGARVGSVLRTRTGVKPLYISPGHLIDQASSRRIALAGVSRYRLPEPTRQAHIAAGNAKKPAEP
jgi:deoxyribonuclease V